MSVRALEFLVPGDLNAATGGYGYDRRIIAGLTALGWQINVHALDASFPEPTAAALVQAAMVLARLPAQALVLIDGLALGAMPRLIGEHADRLRILALVHHPLAAEGGLTHERALGLERSERLALRLVRHVIVTSQRTREALRSLGVEPNHVSVVEPGTDTAPLMRAPRGATVKLLCVATLTERKGHDLLVEALASLPPCWHLTCVGSLTRSPMTVDRLRAQLQRLGLHQQVLLTGEVPAAALTRYYRESDLFVLPTRYEGYGMAVAEALAHGLPVIATRVGAITELVGTEAGLLIAPDDLEQLTTALRRVCTEPALMDSLTRGAAAARDTLPRWQDSCARLSRVLDQDYSTRRTVADERAS